ncbi:hypothetical protein TMatcc_006438 [Talaromyces marneffei ATCC 18224]|uniref:uncharacterized protein n=1 Tax=Talaromyces marneffei TaxID=37727 RepID=UPI0012A92FED|nr:uncharacterized protein EYB26_002624 [Talaromyces marneffei]QGA14968.1 hypothetical protein EYB26_002624 [Talaromyces marneffei]
MALALLSVPPLPRHEHLPALQSPCLEHQSYHSRHLDRNHRQGHIRRQVLHQYSLVQHLRPPFSIILQTGATVTLAGTTIIIRCISFGATLDSEFDPIATSGKMPDHFIVLKDSYNAQTHQPQHPELVYSMLLHK